jgi:transcriptional regulator NrdR family protein
MKCRCGGETFVTNSRDGRYGTIRRRRECDACGERFTTYESRLSPIPALKLAADKVRNKRKNTRAAARAEARRLGQPVEDLYEKWGCA